MSGEKLIAITPQAITPGPIDFTLYCSNPDNTLVLFANRGIEVVDRHIEMLSQSSRRFFIHESELDKYNDYTFDHLENFISNDDITPEAKARILHSIGKRSAKKLLKDPYSDQAHFEVSVVVDSHVDLLLSSPKAASNLFALSALDAYTYSHSVNVASLNVLIMQEIYGNKKKLLLEYGMGGMLHDIGKVLCDETILLKPARLTDEEYKHVKTHPDQSIKLLKGKNYSKHVINAARHHHERMDGKGYPDGLWGNKIPFASRVTAVSDVYDAITSRRVYKDEMPHIEALKIMSSDQGHFDDTIFKALLKIVLKNDELVRQIIAEGQVSGSE